jgi:anti-anti-sigma factor
VKTSTRIVNGKAVVSLDGRFDVCAQREFRDSCNASLDAIEVKELELDLGSVEYLDSFALGMLLLLKEHADTVGKRIVVSNCRGVVRELLGRANFDKLFSIT